jgi:hypothetical protein
MKRAASQRPDRGGGIIHSNSHKSMSNHSFTPCFVGPYYNALQELGTCYAQCGRAFQRKRGNAGRAQDGVILQYGARLMEEGCMAHLRAPRLDRLN